MTSETFKDAYNAHEWAEDAAYTALVESLRGASLEALAHLCDPSERWQTRSHLSQVIIDHASQVLDEKLEAMLRDD